MYLLKNVIFISLLLSGFLPLPSLAYSTDEMNKQGVSTRVVRKYVGQWKGWAHHDNLVNKTTKRVKFSPNKHKPTRAVHSELLRNAAKKLNVSQPKAKKNKRFKRKVIVATTAKRLKSKKRDVVTHVSTKSTVNSLRQFARLLNIGKSRKKTSKKIIVYKPQKNLLKTKHKKIRILKTTSNVHKNIISAKNIESNPKQKAQLRKEGENVMVKETNWSTVSQNLPLLMKALSN